MNIWEDLKKPFFVLAPMDDVTDSPFRRIVARTGAPDLFFTEFANADGLQSRGRERVLSKLKVVDKKAEGPLIAQIWGLDPENYRKTAQELVEMGFDGIDINMGCPTPTVTKKGACSALVNNKPLAAELIAATKDGAGGSIPVSVKCRIGFRAIETEVWTQFLLEQGIAALTIHGRTTKEMSKVPNHWEEIAKVPAIRDSVAPQTVIVGNGDVLSRKQGLQLAEQHGLDGIMVARGIFQDPYLFSPNEEYKLDGRDIYKQHIELFLETWGNEKNPATLKKFAKMYLREFDGASELRTALMQCENAEEMLKVLQ